MAEVFGISSFGRREMQNAINYKISTISMCEKCNILMQINDNNSEKICPSCSYTVSGTVSSSDGTRSKQCIINSKKFNLYSSRASAKQQKFNQALKEFTHKLGCNPQYKFQIDLISSAVKLFLFVENLPGTKRNKVDNRDSVFGACIYYRALEHPEGIIWERREIAKALDLKKEGISKGEKKLIKLHLAGEITLPLNICTLPRYINKYIEMFNIPDAKRDALQNLGERLLEKNVAFNSLNKSKAVGIVTWYIDKYELPYTHQEISTLCFITKQTFETVVRAIDKWPQIIGEEYFP